MPENRGYYKLDPQVKWNFQTNFEKWFFVVEINFHFEETIKDLGKGFKKKRLVPIMQKEFSELKESSETCSNF